MKAEALLALYERVADAPDAIPRLRRFVLDLAVRGKLVKQDAADEPASELLKRVAVDLSVLAKAKKIRQPKPLPDLDEESLPYELPSGWTWTQIGRLGVVSPRVEVDDSLPASFVPMSLIPAEYGASNAHEVRPWGEIKKGYTHLAEGDVALAKITPCFENGKSVVLRNLTGGVGAGTTELHVLRPLIVNADYVVLFLKSPQFIETGIPRMTGTAGQKRVATEYFTSSPFPLPPLAEQHRIVAKVDELMALLDRLDAARSAREATRDRLTIASLTRLTAPDTEAESLRTHACFALNALPALTIRADQIKQLRQTIVDLAVGGRLDLAMTARLSSPSMSEHPYPLPDAWSWIPTQDVCAAIVDCPHSTPGFEPRGIACIDTTCFKDGRLIPSKIRYVSEDTWSLRTARLTPTSGDVVFAREGSVGESVVVPEALRCCLGQRVMLFRPGPSITPRYLQLAISAPSSIQRLVELHKGIGAKHVNVKDMRSALLPVPPLAEQHRIVAKVKELMALCDRLEAALQATDNTRARLLEALLHEALASRADNVIDFVAARARLRPTRSEVGSLIVHHQARCGQGGRIKLGKSLYFAEAHCGLALGGSFGRANFGPHDEWIYTFEREACHAGWFSVGERPLGDGKLRAEYTPCPALAAKAKDARAGLGEQAAELERVLDLLAPLTAEEAEIAATLFAAWNDLLIEGGAVTDEVVITEVREHWHPSKARFTQEVLKQWLGWLRRNGLVPRGRGPSTRQQGRLL